MTRGLMIAAPRSGSGKTTLTLGLLRAFRRRGVAAVGLKSGPDYIDPAFHAAASGGEGVNLDSWAMAPELLARARRARPRRGARWRCAKPRWACSTACRRRDGRSGASADVAAALGLPVLLVVDVSGQAQSAAAVVKGCATYDERLRIAGVVVNRVGSERHRRLVVGGDRSARDPGRRRAAARRQRSRCRSAISGSCRRARRRRSMRASRRWRISSRRMSIATASCALAGELGFAAGAAGDRAEAARPADRARARRGLFVRLSASRPRLAGAPGPRSPPSRLSPTSRRPTIATHAGFRAAIPNCTPGGSRRRNASSTACAASPRQEAGSRRVRRLHGARGKPRRRLGRRACDGGAARRRDELRSSAA